MGINHFPRFGNIRRSSFGALLAATVLLAGALSNAYAAVTINATISTYDAFVAQNPGKAPGMLVIQRADDNDQWNAAGIDWITVNQNKTYSSAKAGTGYYWAFFNHNDAGQAMGCVISGISTIDASNRANGTYLANGASLNITITCTMPTSPSSVSTQAASAITATTATGNGTIVSLGSPNPTAYGICWGLTSSTSSCTNKVDKGAASATGAYTASMAGLTPGTTYYSRAYATNTSGTVYGSAVSFTTSKLTQNITFANPGAQTYGTTPTLSASTSATGLSVSFSSSTTSVCSITSAGALTFLTTGTCTINADQSGNATYSAATTVSQSFSVNAVAPGAPTIGSAQSNAPGQATVSFTAPAANGGSAITSYTVTSNPGSITASGSSSPITVTGLTNGTSYTFSVKANNIAGAGAASTASNAVVPKALQTITFANPGAQNFGTTPTLSASTTATGLSVTFTSSTTGVCTITSTGALTFLAKGTCTIDADQAGNATYAAATVVTQSFSVNAVVPGSPTIGTAQSTAPGQATVSFTGPTFNGGSAITGYTVTSNPGFITATGSSSPITVTGLTNGVSYTFTVQAINVAGSSDASAESNAVTPKAQQAISFDNPGAQNFGTSPTFTASTSAMGLAVSYSSTTTDVCTITSEGKLTFLTIGTCTILAEQSGNEVYDAATPVSQSFAVKAVVPNAPTITAVVAGDSKVTVSFEAPQFNGGAEITGYTITSQPDGISATGSGSPIVVTGLENGTPYTFTVTATNSVGTSVASEESANAEPNAEQSIDFALLKDMTYGAPEQELIASATSDLPVQFASDNEAVALITAEGTLQIKGAGQVTITASQSGGSGYLPATPVRQTITIAKAELTIHVVSDTIVKGENDPDYLVVVEGLVNDDKFADIGSLTITREAGTEAGFYTITAQLNAANYNVHVVPGTLLIEEPTVATLETHTSPIRMTVSNGALNITGYQGNLEYFTAKGALMQRIRVDHDGLYPLPTASGVYTLRLGSRSQLIQVP